MGLPEGHPVYVSSIQVTPSVPSGIAYKTSVGADIKDEMLFQMRELVCLAREQVQIAREQLELMRRAEDRFQKQQEAQREEFQRWFGENPGLAGYCTAAHDHLRTLLGKAIAELVQYVDDNGENLLDSDFARTEMIDKYGSLLNHVSAMYGMLKRLAAAEQSGADSSNGLQC